MTLIIILQAQGSSWPSMIFMVAIIGIFYFFMIRPQQKKAKDQKKFVEEVKKGDLIVTIGGAYGRIAEIEDDTFIIEFERGAYQVRQIFRFHGVNQSGECEKNLGLIN